MSWNLFPLPLFDAGATSSLWRITQVVFDAILLAVVPAITVAMLEHASPMLHKRLANPRRKRQQAVNYPFGRLS
jgi:hypothetical protein